MRQKKALSTHSETRHRLPFIEPLSSSRPPRSWRGRCACCDRHDAIFRGSSLRTITEDVDAAGDLDELRDPTNPGDQRIALGPDLILTFSDLQANIAADLIRRGLNVHAFNQRSVAGILDMIRMLGAILISFSRKLVSDHGSAVFGIASVRMKLPRL